MNKNIKTLTIILLVGLVGILSAKVWQVPEWREQIQWAIRGGHGVRS